MADKITLTGTKVTQGAWRYNVPGGEFRTLLTCGSGSPRAVFDLLHPGHDRDTDGNVILTDRDGRQHVLAKRYALRLIADDLGVGRVELE